MHVKDFNTFLIVYVQDVYGLGFKFTWVETNIIEGFLKENNLRGFIGFKLYPKYTYLSLQFLNHCENTINCL